MCFGGGGKKTERPEPPPARKPLEQSMIPIGSKIPRINPEEPLGKVLPGTPPARPPSVMTGMGVESLRI